MFLSKVRVSGETVKQMMIFFFFLFINIISVQPLYLLNLTVWIEMPVDEACRELLYSTSVRVTFPSVMLLLRLAECMSDFMTQDATLFYKALY